MWFLTESHKGPDHLFAGAAAMLLRSSGFTTRLVVGEAVFLVNIRVNYFELFAGPIA